MGNYVKNNCLRWQNILCIMVKDKDKDKDKDKQEHEMYLNIFLSIN